MPIVSLSSDYGNKDPYRAIVLGVLADLAPQLKLVELSHEIAPGNLLEAAFIIGQAYPSFPKGTVHLILNQELDGDGVFLAMELDGQFFIAADNGLLSLLQGSKKAKAIHRIEIGESGSSLFPGRDFLAKAAVHLAQGGALSILGKPVDRINQSKAPQPKVDRERRQISGKIIYIDHYGNLITNISKAHLQDLQGKDFEINLPRNRSLSKLARSYQDSAQDGVLALINSLGLLEIAFRGAIGKEYNGANSLLGLGLMDEISINYWWLVGL